MFESSGELVPRWAVCLARRPEHENASAGRKFTIDTPTLLASVAVSRGWVLEEMLPFDSYQRDDVHKENPDPRGSPCRPPICLTWLLCKSGTFGYQAGASPTGRQQVLPPMRCAAVAFAKSC